MERFKTLLAKVGNTRHGWVKRNKRKREDVGSWERDLTVLFNMNSDPFHVDKPIAYRREAFHCLQHIIEVATDQQLSQLELKHLIWTMLGFYCYFNLLFNYDPRYKHRRDYTRASHLYQRLSLRMLHNGILQQEEVLRSIFDFCADLKLWVRESLVVSIMLRPLTAGAPLVYMLSLMLDRLEHTFARNGHEARHLVRIMCEVFNFSFWPPLDSSTENVILRLLGIYRECLVLEYNKDPSSLAPVMRKGLEVVIRCIVEHLANKDLILIVGHMLTWIKPTKKDVIVLTFGSVIEHAALVHVTNLYEDTFADNVFSKLLEVIRSARPYVSHLGNRILQYLLDRHDNWEQFISPRIYFQNTHFNVRVCTLQPKDKSFIMKHRSIIHSSIIAAMIKHGRYQENLKTLYRTVCLLATEVPCAYTAAVFANLCMNIQGVARENTTLRSISKFNLNAVVASIMSLLCWLHNAPDFYKYVNTIVNLRAEVAPHLNPPIRHTYSFAQHHVHGDKDELFFDDWNVRYSLWMRFRIQHAAAYLEAMNAAAPPTEEELTEAAATETSLAVHVEPRTRRELLRSFLPARPAFADEQDVVADSEVETDKEDEKDGMSSPTMSLDGSRKPMKLSKLKHPAQWSWAKFQREKTKRQADKNVKSK